MAAQGGEYIYALGLDTKAFEKSAERAKRAFVGMTGEIVDSGDKIDAAMQKIKSRVAALATLATFKELTTKLIEVRGEMQKLAVAYETMLGSKEKADALMSDVVRLAAKTPFGLEDVSNATKMLLAYGSTAEDVAGEINMLGNIASGLSIPLNDLIMLYGTTRTQGQLFTQDLRQFMSRGIPLADELAKQFGVTKDKVGDLVAAGKVGFNDVAIALRSMTSEGGQFYNLMEKQSETLAGQMSNLEDAIYQMFNSIGEQKEGILSGAISAASSLVENYERVGRVLKSLVVSYGVYKTALAIATQMTKGYTFAEIAHFKALVLAEKAQKLLNATMMSNPYVAAAAAIMTVVVALASMKTETERLQDAQESYNQTLQDLIDKENEERQEVEKLISVADDEALATDTRRQALHNLILKYPEIFAQYSTEYDMLLNLKKIKEEIAALEGKNSITSAQNQLKLVEQQIKELEGKGGYIQYGADALKNMGGDSWLMKYVKKLPAAWSTLSAVATYRGYNNYQDDMAMLKTLYDERDKLTAKIAKETTLGNIDTLDKVALQAQRDKLNELAAQKKLGKEVNLKAAGFTGFTEDDLEGLLKTYDMELSERSQSLMTASEMRAYTKAEEAKARKALNDFDRSNKKLSTQALKDEREKLLADLKTKEDEAKKWAPIGGGGKGGGAKTAAQKEAARKAEQEAKITNQIMAQNEDMRIELMEDGLDKELAVINREYEKRVAAIRQRELELYETRKTLTKEQEEALKQALADAEALKNKEEQKLLEERANAYNDYLAQYGTLKEREVAIAAKYDRLITEAKAEGNVALVAQLEQERLAEEAAFSDEVKKYAEAIKDYTANQLSIEIHNMEQKVKEIQASMDAMETSDSAEYKAAAAAVAELVAKIGKANEAYENLVKPNPELEQKLAELDEFAAAMNGVAQQFDAAADIVGMFDEEIGNSLKSMGSLIPSLVTMGQTIVSVTMAAKEAKRALSAMEKASITLAAISFALQVIRTVAEGVKQALNREFDEFEKLKEQYETISDIWSELIDKKMEYLSMSYGAEARNAAEEARRLIEEEEELNRDMARERTDTRRERKKAVEGMTYAGYQELVNAGLAEDWGGASTSIAYGEYGKLQKRIDWQKLLNMTPEELASLRDNAKEFWATMDDDLRTYLENVIATGEKSAEVEDMIRERLTQISFDDLSDSFFDAMMDMDATAEEVANNVSEYFFKAMMMNNMGEAYKERLNKWYEDFYAAMDDADGLTDAEREELRKRYTDIVEQGIAERDAIAEATGYDATSASQQATSKGFQAMSQETGSELNGRFTDIQGQTHRIAEAVEFMQGIQMQQSQYLQSVSSTLASIHNDTSLIAEHTKALGEIRNDISVMRRAMDNGII